jgi:ABC-type microcin C transport system duplicated ATPase subunit YejF
MAASFHTWSLVVVQQMAQHVVVVTPTVIVEQAWRAPTLQVPVHSSFSITEV